jgi:hypothetical protein
VPVGEEIEMAEDRQLIKKTEALRMAAEMGCRGAHKDRNGNWMPCSSMEELERRSNVAETGKWRTVLPRYEKSEDPSEKKRRKKGRRKRRRSDWENLREMPTGGFEHVEGAGIVSADLMAPVAPAAAPAAGPAGGPVVAMSKVAQRMGPEYVRETDPDVFMDPESARSRAQRLGCIGISRRISKNGRAVWMPCTNMSDYANRTGSTALGRRNMERARKRETQRFVRTIVAADKKRPQKKSLITDELIRTRFVL